MNSLLNAYMQGMMRRGGARTWNLPQYDLLSPGTVLEEFDGVAGWTNIAGTVEDNTTAGEFRTGTQSMKFTCAAGAAASARKAINVNFGGVAPHMRLSFYCYDGDDYIDKAQYIRVYIYSGAAYFLYTLNTTGGAPGIIHPGWVTLDIWPSSWANVGNDWSNTMDRLLVQITPKAAQGFSISFDRLLTGLSMAPAVLMTFDDASPSMYTAAFPYMQTKRARGTFYVITGDVGGGGKVTSAQLAEMYAAGWDIANHSDTNDTLGALTEGEVTTIVTTAKNKLDAWGFTRSSAHFAYPGGAHSVVSRAGVAAAGMLTGRITSTNYANCHPDQNYMIQPVISLTSTTTLAAATAFIDTILANGGIAVFYGHTLAAEAGSNIWAIADFQALVDYIAARNIPFLTMSDFYNLQSGPVVISG